MKRKDFLMMFTAIIVCMILGVFIMLGWLIIVIPAMINPRLIPDPRPRIAAAVIKHGMRNAMKGQNLAAAK